MRVYVDLNNISKLLEETSNCKPSLWFCDQQSYSTLPEEVIKYYYTYRMAFSSGIRKYEIFRNGYLKKLF